MSVRVQVNRIGDPSVANHCLDEMEQASGLRGEPNSKGRLYVVAGDEFEPAVHEILEHLPKGWQDHLSFEL